MKKTLLLAAIFFYTLSMMGQETFMVKTETRYWDASRTYDGYTLFGTRGTTYLIDMEGHVVHTWPIGKIGRAHV